MFRPASKAIAVLALLIPTAGFTGTAISQLGWQQGLVEPNTASEQELMALPHMSATIAQGMLERHPFLSLADLNSFLSGSLNEQQRKKLYGKMFLHLNLNTAHRKSSC